MDISSLVPVSHQQNLDFSTVTASYNKLSENLRKITPIGIQCAIFCGGSKCKYENPKAWLPVHMAIQDIFSHWVTDDILAMARPNTLQLLNNNLITQFQRWSIKTIINLQTPGEHGSCGVSLGKSGFTYDPVEFMKNGIYYYNFALKDYDKATIEKLLDMVKVVAFSIQEGRVAIHCHAGLGRTGVLIACYLVYSLRVRANDAIRFVRKKRPGAIQTRGQIKCIQDFEFYILPQMIIYPLKYIRGSNNNNINNKYNNNNNNNNNSINNNKNNNKSENLQSYLNKQWNILHGYEQRTFKFIPKIVFILCERILQLCDCQEDNSPAQIDFSINDKPFVYKFISHALENIPEDNGNIKYSLSWTEYLSQASFDYSNALKIRDCSISSKDTCEDIKKMDDIVCTTPESTYCSTNCPTLDDNLVDDFLADGIHNQELYDNNCYKELQSQLFKNSIQKEDYNFIAIDQVLKALLFDYSMLQEDEKKILIQYQADLNDKNSTWQWLELETNVKILSGLLYEWLETLKEPILDMDSLSQIVIRGSRLKQCLQKLQTYNRYILEYFLRFVSRLRPMSMDMQSLIIKRIIASLTHQSVWIKNMLMPSDKNYQKLRTGTAGKLIDFTIRFLNFIEEINTQELSHSSWFSLSKWSINNKQLYDVHTEENS